MKFPLPRPCGSCPYRRDVPSGVWAESEYRKLPLYDQPTGDQPVGVFMCHRDDGHICAGWAGCHDMGESLAIRLAFSAGHPVDEAILDFETAVPLWGSGEEAAEHGLRDLEHPSIAARRIVDKFR